MGVLYALESIRTPALDKIMSVITLLGGELFFMVIAVTVFWCVSKREGYYLMIVGFFGTVINQFLKILCCVPRPWIKDPDFTIVESARAEATGYSFPSGHTQNAVATYGGIARYTRRGWLRVVLVVLTVLIAFSRMYLGVHTPLDVGVSFLIAAVLVLVVYPLMEEADRRPVVLTYTILAMVVCSGAFVGYLYMRGDTGATAEDTANYVSALENGWKLLGATLGMLVSNIADRKHIRFETQAVWWAQLIKLVVGFACLLAIRSGLKAPLIALLGGNAAIAMYYAGDYLTMLENNEDLAFVIPEEGSNWFVDAMCVLKDTQHMSEAEEWINFIASTDSNLANMDYIWYASPNREALEQYPAYYAEVNEEELDPEIYEIMAPPAETLDRCEIYENLPKDTLRLYDRLWTRLGV